MPHKWRSWQAYKNRHAAEADVWEAVFRYQFEYNTAHSGGYHHTYFLSIRNGEDPDLDFMERFRRHVPRVEPVSESTKSGSRYAHVIHRESGRTGIIFWAASVEWVTDHIAEVEGGYHEAALSASGDTYRVERRGRWFVTGHVMHWMA